MTGTVCAEFQTFLSVAFGGRFGAAAPAASLQPVGEGGSHRQYYRLGRPPRSLVGLRNETPVTGAGGRDENRSFLYVATHLRRAGVSVPEVFAADLARGWFALEDAGEELLLDRRRQQGESSGLLSVYGQVVADLARMHHWASPGFRTEETHNPDYRRDFIRQWESGYFQRSFLQGFLGWDPSPLDGELNRLADAAGDLWTPHFLHRDFQSTNVALREGVPVYLDFQGARRGPRQYDLASLLWDPYVELSALARRKLLLEYLERSAQLDRDFDPESFEAGYPVIVLHRLMQALGAYGHLSRAAGKPDFARHIPAAVRQLGRLFEAYPELTDYGQVAACVERLGSLAEGLSGTAYPPPNLNNAPR